MARRLEKHSVKHRQLRFLVDDEGASLAEYALLLGVLAIALVLVIGQFKDSIGNTFSRTTSVIATTGDGAGAGAGAGTGGGAGGSGGGPGNGEGGPPCGTPPCGGGRGGGPNR
jgi:pilus assembly protein Flp/PilA